MVKTKKHSRRALVLLTLTFSASYVSASGLSIIKDIPCSILSMIYDTMTAVAGTLVFLMFIYGGLKYAFSSDDPGGRKQGKMICIHATIGGILIAVWSAIQSSLSGLATWLSFTGCL